MPADYAYDASYLELAQRTGLPLATLGAVLKAVTERRYFLYAEKKPVDHMEVHLTPELEKKLNDLAAQSGRPATELAQDVIAGYVDELADTRAVLDRRYDDIKSGKVKLIPGDEVFERLRRKSQALRQQRGE
jgi:predicted DNA-binding protein